MTAAGRAERSDPHSTARLWTGDPKGCRPNQPFTWGAQPHNGLIYFNDINSGVWITRLKDDASKSAADDLTVRLGLRLRNVPDHSRERPLLVRFSWDTPFVLFEGAHQSVCFLADPTRTLE